MTLSAYVFANPTANLNGEFVEFQIRLPWFRSLPLSSVRRLALHSANSAGVWLEPQISIDDAWLSIENIAERWQQEWFVQDAKTVRLKAADLASAIDSQIKIGDQIDLSAEFDLMMPNLFMAPNQPVIIHSAAQGTLNIR